MVTYMSTEVVKMLDLRSEGCEFKSKDHKAATAEPLRLSYFFLFFNQTIQHSIDNTDDNSR